MRAQVSDALLPRAEIAAMRILIIVDEQKMARLMKKGLEEENRAGIAPKSVLSIGRYEVSRA